MLTIKVNNYEKHKLHRNAYKWQCLQISQILLAECMLMFYLLGESVTVFYVNQEYEV